MPQRRAPVSAKKAGKAGRFLHENGLSIVLFSCFLALLAGQAVTGYRQHNQDLQEHGEQRLSWPDYLRSDHFLEATTENWESEFLQMFAYVLLTVFLYQKGSSESKKLSEPESVEKKSETSPKNVPWPVRQGGLVLKVYENSLALAFLLLFLASFCLHVIGGTGLYNKEQAQHGSPPISAITYLVTSRFWFEAFQNWQSEFLAIGSMVVLSIFLRQKGSPESKPVDSPHSQTGND